MIVWLIAAWAAELVVVERASGDPVAGASVTWDGGSATTDDRGRVQVPSQVPLAVAAEGWLPRQVTLGVDQERGRVWLEPAPASLEIVVEGMKSTSHATRHAVDAGMALETPGNHEDAVRLVQSLPGVAVQREYAPGAGDLVVRGAAPAESRYYLDGIEIPYLYHFNQYASVFPASQLASLELFPSTFGAAYGDAVGGVVEARSPLEPPQAVHGSVSTSFVMGGGDVRAPVGRRGWWLSASGRRSYLDFAGDNSTQYPRWPRFWDFGLRAEHGDAERGTGAFVWGAGDAWTRVAGELDALDPVEGSRSALLDFAKGFQVLGGRHHWTGERWTGRAVLAAVHDQRVGSLDGGGLEARRSWRLVSRTDATWRRDDLAVDAGWLVQGERVGLEVAPHPEGLQVAEELPWLARGEAVDDALIRGRADVYATAQLPTGPLRWMPGLRLASDSAGAPILVEPRAAARASLGEQTALRVGGGRYHQRPDAAELLAVPDLPTTGSWQVAVGAEQTVSGRLELGLDLWKKWLQHPLIRPVDAPPRAADSGDGMGVELVTRYRLREKFFLWGWLAVSRTTLIEGGREQFSDGDQPLQGGAVASWDVGRFNLGLRYRYGSGLPWTPIDGSIYQADTDQWLPVPGEDNAARFPAYQKLDLRTAYEATFRGWSIEVAFEMWIVPEASAQLYPVWSYDYREQTWVIGPTVFPMASARARF